jgi:molecular chaperone GrpE
MDDTVKRAEELLEERMRSQHTNGHAAVDDAPESATEGEATASLTRDLQRLAADFSNDRKRNEAERVDFVKYAKADLIKRLLEVLDGYDRALETAPADAEGQPWLEGLRLVERKLRQLLESEGLQPLEAVGTRFDPYQHEAVAHLESDAPEGTVISEYQKGYRLHDRIIRPALVTVSKGPGGADGSGKHGQGPLRGEAAGDGARGVKSKE